MDLLARLFNPVFDTVGENGSVQSGGPGQTRFR
jgi:hypothetical protein